MCVGGGDGGAVGAVHPLFWVACLLLFSNNEACNGRAVLWINMPGIAHT